MNNEVILYKQKTVKMKKYIYHKIILPSFCLPHDNLRYYRTIKSSNLYEYTENLYKFLLKSTVLNQFVEDFLLNTSLFEFYSHSLHLSFCLLEGIEDLNPNKF